MGLWWKQRGTYILFSLVDNEFWFTILSASMVVPGAESKRERERERERDRERERERKREEKKKESLENRKER